jgi:hypothetical protein
MPASGLTALFRVQLAFGQAGSLKAALSRLFCRLRILQMFLEEGNEPGERFADRFGLAADQEPLTKRFLDRLDCEPKALGEAGQERDIHADELAGRILVADRRKAAIRADCQLTGDQGCDRRRAIRHLISFAYARGWDSSGPRSKIHP